MAHDIASPDSHPNKVARDLDPVTTPVSVLVEKHTRVPKMSKGEKLFDMAVYGGIAGVGVFIAGIFLTYWSRYGIGKQWFEKSVKLFEKTPINKSTAETAVMTVALSMAGNASVIPVKIAENHKAGLVSKFNDMLGEDKNAPITNADKPQTWGSLIKGRLLAIASVFTGFKVAEGMIGKERFEHYENLFAEKVACKPFNKPTHNGAAIVENETKAFRYGKIAALDLYATVAATALLYLGSRFFSQSKKIPAKTTLASSGYDTKSDQTIPAVTRIAPQKKPASSFAEAVEAGRQQPSENSMSAAL